MQGCIYVSIWKINRNGWIKRRTGHGMKEKWAYMHTCLYVTGILRRRNWMIPTRTRCALLGCGHECVCVCAWKLCAKEKPNDKGSTRYIVNQHTHVWAGATLFIEKLEDTEKHLVCCNTHTHYVVVHCSSQHNVLSLVVLVLSFFGLQILQQQIKMHQDFREQRKMEERVSIKSFIRITKL